MAHVGGPRRRPLRPSGDACNSEAVLFHQLDDMDSKMEAVHAAVEANVCLPEPWPARVPSLGCQILDQGVSSGVGRPGTVPGLLPTTESQALAGTFDPEGQLEKPGLKS
jgi:hypothetical protein